MSRIVLGLDTATEITVVGLGFEDDDGRFGLLEGDEIDAPRAAMSRVLPAVERLLARRGIPVAEIGVVVVGRGPGSFTGVRIGVSAAKGLAQGLSVPLYGVGTLDSIAWQVARDYDGLVGVVGDAMRGEVYPALFETSDGNATRFAADAVAKPVDAASRWAAEVGERDVLLVGNGLRKHAAAFVDALGGRATIGAEELWRPTAFGMMSAFATAGAATLGSGEPAELLPVYTRLSDAEENERAKHGGALPSSGVAGPAGVDAESADGGGER